MFSFKKLCTYYQILTIILLSTLCIYAIIGGYDNRLNRFPAFISHALAQEQQSQPYNSQTINSLKQSASGFFTKMRFADKAYNLSDINFTGNDGSLQSLKDFKGKILLVNFWAIWCPPCRKEMPELSHLKTILSSDDFDVITINVDTVAEDDKLKNFLAEIKAENLPLYRDKKMETIRELRDYGLAYGLPITILLDENGYVLASYNGAAPWGNDDAQKLITKAVALKNNP